MQRVLAIAGTNAAPRPGHVRDAGTASWPLLGRMHHVLAIAGTNAPRPGHVRDAGGTVCRPSVGKTSRWENQGKGQGRRARDGTRAGHIRGVLRVHVFIRPFGAGAGSSRLGCPRRSGAEESFRRSRAF